MRYLGITFILFICTCSSIDGSQGLNPFPKNPENAQWLWSDRCANLLYSIESELGGIGGYAATLTVPQMIEGVVNPITVKIQKNGKTVLTFKAHSQTVFTRINDVLCVAEFQTCSTGSSIVAYDLKKGIKLWRCRLKGNSPQAHSIYTHEINIESNGNIVIVYGREDNGRYIEFVDSKNGRNLGCKQLPPEKAK